MDTRAILLAATAIAATMSATPASALVPMALDASIDQTALDGLSEHATLAPKAFERPDDSAYEPTARIANNRANLQCVPYARTASGVDLFGDANTWWDQAKDHFVRVETPEEKSVIVLRGYAGADRGHVAVVREIVSDRMIIVDHANWLNHGEITRDVPMRDVSPRGDWSQVQVWNVPGKHWGSRTYNVQGFILNQIAPEAAATASASAVTATPAG